MSAHEALLRQAREMLDASAASDAKRLSYYQGSQALTHLGLAVPPQLSALEMVVNWPRVVVDTIEERQDVRSIEVVENDALAVELRRVFDANNLDSELISWKRDLLIYGRAFVSVGVGEDGQPRVMAESPREIAVQVNRQTRELDWAVRLYDWKDNEPRLATIYEPGATTFYAQERGKWSKTGAHSTPSDRVPVFATFNRRMTGVWSGESEMADIAPITDAAARALTDLQLAVETNALPKRIITGAKQSEFNSKDGWFNYMQPFFAIGDSAAKAFQLNAADLKNFHETVILYGKLASSVTGFPARFFGLVTTNPPSHDAIRAEEAKLVKRVERANSICGATLAEVFALCAQILGHDVDRGMVNVYWHDPATPTLSQKADAAQKLTGGKPILSMRGAWELLGWTPAQMDAEESRLRAEMSDPDFAELMAKDTHAAE